MIRCVSATCVASLLLMSACSTPKPEKEPLTKRELLKRHLDQVSARFKKLPHDGAEQETLYIQIDKKIQVAKIQHTKVLTKLGGSIDGIYETVTKLLDEADALMDAYPK